MQMEMLGALGGCTRESVNIGMWKNSVAFSGGNGSIKDLLTPPVKGKKW